MPHGIMTLVIKNWSLVTYSHMIVACVIWLTNEKYNQFKYIFHQLSM